MPTVDEAVWTAEVEQTDALLVWGGDPLYLAYWLQESGLADYMRSQQLHAVYVGVSAGAMAARIPARTYAIDDQSAVKLTEGAVEVVSEGHRGCSTARRVWLDVSRQVQRRHPVRADEWGGDE